MSTLDEMTNTQSHPRAARSIDLLWLSLALFIILSIALLLPLSPQDYWWYLRLGQDIAQTGSIPTVDTYSYSRAGTPFFYQSWLAALVFWKIYEAGGLLLTFFLRALIIAVTHGLLFFLIRDVGIGPRLASLLTLLAALAGSSNWSIRPQLFTYPLFVWAFFILWKWSRGQKSGVWFLPLIAVLWVNLHGSFLLLFILGVLALVLGRGSKKQLLLSLFLSFVALLINPHGVNVFGYVINMLNSPSNQLYSIEWLPMVNRGWQANLFFLWLLVFAPLAAFSPRKLTLFEWGLFLSLGWLALTGIRYVIWFVFILAVTTARLLAEWDAQFLESPVQNEKPVINILAASILLLMPFALVPGFRESWWPEAPRAYDKDTPVKAAEWLGAHSEFEGPLWSDFGHSSYLIFALPSRPIWIDTRFELYPPEQWRQYAAAASASPQWQELLDKEGVQLAMLSTYAQPMLIKAMRSSDEWCENYHDEDAVIFSRRGSAQCP